MQKIYSNEMYVFLQMTHLVKKFGYFNRKTKQGITRYSGL